VKRFLQILLFVLASILVLSCQREQTATLEQLSYQSHEHRRPDDGSLLSLDAENRFREGLISEGPSLSHTVLGSEKSVEADAGGETETPASHDGSGSRAFSGYCTSHSFLHFVFGGFVQRTTVPIRSFVSHVSLFYMLRHIIR